MLKAAYRIGARVAFEEAGFYKTAAFTKKAGKGTLLRRVWQAATKTPARKAMLGSGLGLGALGTGLALMPREEEPSMLQRAGTAAKDLLGNPEFMTGLTSAFGGGNLGGLMGLTASDESQGLVAFPENPPQTLLPQSFPPPPEGVPQPSSGLPPGFDPRMLGGGGM